MKRLLQMTTRLQVWLETMISAVVSSKHNPFYYHGALPIICFWVLIITGLMEWAYYVPTLQGAWASMDFFSDYKLHPFGWAFRTIHRYAADAMMIFVILHMIKVYMTDRHRGIRHVPWLSGILLIVSTWVIGITGYLLVWDERSLLMTNTTVQVLNAVPLIGNWLGNFFIGGQSITDFTIVRFLFFHIMLTCVIFFGMWIHLLRIREGVVYPTYFLNLIILGGILVIVGALPVASEPPAQIGAPPASMHIDWFYMIPYWILGATHSTGAVWAFTLLFIGALFAAPYIPFAKRNNTALVYKDKCVGCTLCAEDCPYQAIDMANYLSVDKKGKKRIKRLAVVFSPRCVECGICVGACDFDAIDLPNMPAIPMEQSILGMIKQKEAL